MKKILTLLALMISLTSFAQQQKGDLAIQFSGNYIQQKIRIDKFTQRYGAGNIYLKIGKYFTTNLEMGVKPNLNFSLIPKFISNKSGEITQVKNDFQTNVGFGIYGTYSFLTNDGKLLPYAGAELSYAPLGKEQTINLGPYAGAKYFVTERVNIDANLSFLMNLGSTYEEPKGSYEIGPMWYLNIGVGVLLGKLN